LHPADPKSALAFAAAAVDDGYLPIPIAFVIELQTVAVAAAEPDERIEARYSASDGWDNPGWPDARNPLEDDEEKRAALTSEPRVSRS